MNILKKIIIFTFVSLMLFSTAGFADIPEVDLGKSSTNNHLIDGNFIADNQDLIEELIEDILNTDNVYNDEKIRNILIDNFQTLKENGAESETPQDELYDIIWELGTLKSNRDPKFEILKLYIQDYSSLTTRNIAEKIIILILTILLFLIIVYIVIEKIHLKNRRKKSEKKAKIQYEYNQDLKKEDNDINYSKKYGISPKKVYSEEEITELQDDILNLNVTVSDLKKKIEKKEKTIDELFNENDKLYQDNLMLTEENRSLKEKKVDSDVISPLSEGIKKNLVIEKGQIQIVDGDYVEIQYNGNKISVSPTDKALSLSVRRSLQHFFNFSGRGNRSINVTSPCILEIDSQGYYKILSKGNVYLV